MPVTIKASLWFMICSIMQKGIAFVTTPIFTRLMSKTQYGQVTLYNSWLEIFTLVATLNVFYGVFNNILVNNQEKKDQVTANMLGFCTTLTVAVFLLYLIFSKWINLLTRMSTLMTCLLFAEILFIPSFRLWSAKLRFDYEYRPVIIASLIISVITPLLGIPAVLWAEEKGYAKIITSIIAQISVSLVLYIIVFKKNRQFYNHDIWKYALMFNLPLVPHYLSATILNQSDRIMIDRMCGTDKAGVYGLAYTVGMLIIIVTQAINSTYTPWVYKKIKTGEFREIRKYTNFLIVIVGAFSILLVAFAPEIMWLLGGEEYAEGVWIVAPISASVFFRFLYNLYSNVELYYEETKYIMFASVLTAIANIALNYVFIKRFGYLAAGYTTLFCFMLYALAHGVIAHLVSAKHSQIRHVYNDGAILCVAVVVAGLSLGMMALYNLTIIRYTFIILITVLAFVFRAKILNLINVIRQKEQGND